MSGAKNIIFDFGGVLVDLDKEACVRAFDRIGAHSISGYVDECRTEDLFHELELGSITPAEFCVKARGLSGCDATDDEILGAWNSLLVSIPARRLHRLLELRGRYRLFLLSNTNIVHWEHAVSRLFPMDGYGVSDYFDNIYLSYELHQVKPCEEIFRHVLDDAGIVAADTLFIDDSPVNCRAARETGIRALNATGDEWLDLVR